MNTVYILFMGYYDNIRAVGVFQTFDRAKAEVAYHFGILDELEWSRGEYPPRDGNGVWYLTSTSRDMIEDAGHQHLLDNLVDVSIEEWQVKQ